MFLNKILNYDKVLMDTFYSHNGTSEISLFFNKPNLE